MSEKNGFTDEQKNFLQGFAMGSDVARAVKGLPILAGSGGNGNGAGSVVQLGPAGARVEPAPAPALPTSPERLQSELQLPVHPPRAVP